MKHIDGKVFYTIGEVAKKIERGAQTIKNWYEWAEVNNALDMLPTVYTNLDAKGTRYFEESDIDKLIDFKKQIKYGMMADINREKWGARGLKVSDK